ncbi:RNA-directed DNA polymerase from mobile element jockey-like [Brachionus plicatilis]|uniref:RNA-directed DNA polymerase from mobile element jockey-like n=1 Tax=Brachionus plicatilis TaxID=10195 RepID=A0A3M7Q1C1_BRAPC|nr:RNA-directed DNA polymerase from mobile element jockey-like [Brachionus plicatilis]
MSLAVNKKLFNRMLWVKDDKGTILLIKLEIENNLKQKTPGSPKSYTEFIFNLPKKVNAHKQTKNLNEQVWCNIKVNDESIIVGCIYRPPFADCEINSEINRSIGYASHLCSSSSSKSFLVAGDFNFPDISWSQDGGFCTNEIAHPALNS